LLELPFSVDGKGKDGLLRTIKEIQKYSVNTWSQGFLDKLYASTNPVGVAADLFLSSLNTNVHVYQVSPALTLVEKQTSKALAGLFGLHGQFSGGVSQPGGSAANQSSLIIARNTLFPETKSRGNGRRKFVLFTSVHGHYSTEKAAQMLGFGSDAVRSVPVDEAGCLKASELSRMIDESRIEGETPFYVSATAGTTVLGSFDPLEEIADVCQKHGLWFHVDGSWGGPVVFSETHSHKVKGINRADTITICPHKMMGVPLTCSFLLGKDLRNFQKAMSLPAGYLFHGDDDGGTAKYTTPDLHSDGTIGIGQDFWDLADLTPQCGRRGDSLKLLLSWVYYGSSGFRSYIDGAFDIAAYMAETIAANPKFSLVSSNPPPCLQVCFYYRKQMGSEVVGWRDRNSRTTEMITKLLVARGFMIDYAPGKDGKFFRVVVNGHTKRSTVEGLIKAIDEVGSGVEVSF